MLCFKRTCLFFQKMEGGVLCKACKGKELHVLLVFVFVFVFSCKGKGKVHTRAMVGESPLKGMGMCAGCSLS